MTADEAIHRAKVAVLERGSNVLIDNPQAIFKERHMRFGKDRSGWLVVFQLNVPPGFETDMLYVEVYEPYGEVHIPELL